MVLHAARVARVALVLCNTNGSDNNAINTNDANKYNKDINNENNYNDKDNDISNTKY